MADELLIEWPLAAWIEALPQAVAVGAKVYPWAKAPQQTAVKPIVLYHRISSNRVRSLSGPTTGVSHPRIQLDVISRDYLVAKRLAMEIRKELEDLPHGYDMGGKTVQVAIIQEERDAEDADTDAKHGTELSEHRVILELEIWFVEG